MSDRDDEICPQEKVSFTQINAAVNHSYSAKYDKHRVSVGFQLWTLMCPVSVFNGQFVQAKLALDPCQHLFIRLIQSDPDEPVRLLKDLTDFIELDISRASAIRIRNTIDDGITGVWSRT